jgi:ribosomal protein S18 acetylase RimI-like enzyme
MEIIQCTINDWEICQKIARQTFFETYEKGTDAKDLEKYMTENFSTDAIKEELTSSSCAVFMLKDKAIVGYIKLRWDTTHELLDANAIELQRIYVLNEYQGKGYGKMLIEHAEQYARNHGFEWIWLCVWYENHGAIRFYERSGWEKFGDKQFKFGDHVYLDPVLRKKL